MPVPYRFLVPGVAVALALALPAPSAEATPASPAPSVAASAAGRTSDFDGDGKPDLAIGVDVDMGLVHVTYGSGTQQTFTRKDLDPTYLSTYSDLGAAILARDFDGDGYTDLAVGDPQDWRGSQPAVFVVYGSASGLKVSSPAQLEGPEALSTFGSSLALVERPARLLVVGQRNAAYGDTRGGTLAVYPLSASGIPSMWPSRLLSQDSWGVPGKGAAGDQFGAALAATGSTLVVGAPGDKVGTASRAGSVTVITFRSGGKKYTARQYTQNTARVPGTAERSDEFGSSVAAVSGVVAVGVPGEDRSSGSVQVFRLRKGKLAAWQKYSQNSAGIPGHSESLDQFGSAIAFSRPCVGALGLLVGAWYEKVGSVDYIAGSAWSIPLTKRSSCPVRRFEEGGVLGGKPTKWASVGKTVGVLRSASGSVADTFVLAAPGETEESVPGRVLTLTPPHTGPAKVVFTSPAFSIALSPVQG